MGERIKLGTKEYDSDDFGAKQRQTLKYFNFTSERLKELKNMQALLQRAKNSYIKSLKSEVLSRKSGFILGDE